MCSKWSTSAGTPPVAAVAAVNENAVLQLTCTVADAYV